MLENGEGDEVRKQQEAYNTLEALTKTQQRKSAVIEASGRNILIESADVLNGWTECCSGLYNCKLHPDTSLLQNNQHPTQEAENPPVLRAEVRRLRTVWKHDSLQEWTISPLSCLRMEARQQQQS